MEDIKKFMETMTGKVIVVVGILAVGLFIGSRGSWHKNDSVVQVPTQEVAVAESTGPIVANETHSAPTQKTTAVQNKTMTAPKLTTSVPTIVSAPTPSAPKQNLRVEGLTTIRVSVGLWENWDADVDNDGPVLEIVYLDNQGNIITSDATEKMPITADVKLYAGSDSLSKKNKVVYSGHFDSSQIILGGIYPRIRIPKEKINVDPNTDYQYGESEVTIHTPEQGDFAGTSILAVLYE